jgi:hypothetical protein
MMITDSIVTIYRRNKITGDHDSALVDQLVKRMLSVCARLAPDYRACQVVHSCPVSVDTLAITFHITLLKIGGKTVQVLVIWKNRFRL